MQVYAVREVTAYLRELIESALGSIEDAGHDWDADPAEWVREQRRAEQARVG